MKQWAFVFGIVPFLCAYNSSAFSADVDARGCTVAALVQGGGAVDGQHFFELTSPNPGDINWWQGSLEGALAYGCDGWNIQADGAFNGFWASKDYPPAFIFPGGPGYFQSRTGHIGADAFWRNSEKGMFGVSASRIFTMTSSHFPTDPIFPNPDVFGGGLWRIGGMGEVYANESLTLGGGVYYVDGYPRVDFQHLHGWEGDIYAKFYANPDFSLSLRGDVQTTQADRLDAPIIAYTNGFAGSLQAEYLIPDTSLSVFAGGRFASRRQTYNNTADYVDINDKIAYVGLTYAFGSVIPKSLLQRDRSGTVDNTSVMSEKLPDFNVSAIAQ